MKLSNRTLVANRKFHTSFLNLAAIVEMPAKEKIALVKLRKKISEHLKDLQEVTKDMDDVKSNEVLNQEADFDFESIDANLVINKLSADDLTVLGGNILTEV